MRTSLDRRTARAAALLLLTGALAGCVTMHPSTESADGRTSRSDTGVRAVLDSMADGWNRGDLALYLSGYAHDVTSRGMDGFVTGVPAAREVMLQGFWKTGRPLQALHYEHVVTRPLGDNFAFATGQYVLTGGDVAERRGWFTTIWRRTATSWRCIHDHS